MYEIWHDNDFDLAHWLFLNSDLKDKEVHFRQIPKTNSTKDLMGHLKVAEDLVILRAIKYETPDLVIVHKPESGSPTIELVIEFMTHVPQHHHPLQRFTRLYGAAWQEIPSVLVIPERKEKLEKRRGGEYTPATYRVNPLIRHLFIKTAEITKTPTFLLMWPERSGYLKYDRRHPTAPHIEGDISVLLELVNNLGNNIQISQMGKDETIKQKSESGYLPDGNSYRLTTGKVISTEAFIDELPYKIETELASKLISRAETYLFSPQGLKKEFRTDPYAGMLCAFDMLFCRNQDGARVRNLVLMASNVPSKTKKGPTLQKFHHNVEECPFIHSTSIEDARSHFLNFCPFTNRKQQRIYGTVPDMVFFPDGGTYVP